MLEAKGLLFNSKDGKIKTWKRWLKKRSRKKLYNKITFKEYHLKQLELVVCEGLSPSIWR